MTKPSLLYHFRSKDELRRGVLDNLFDHWATVLPRLLRAVTTGEGQFDALMSELLTFFSDDEDRALLVVRELMDRPDEMQGRILDSLQPLVRLIADYMRRGQTAGRLQKDVDPEAYILHMIALTISSVATGRLLEPVLAGGSDPARKRQANELMRIARTSLFAMPGSEPPRDAVEKE